MPLNLIRNSLTQDPPTPTPHKNLNAFSPVNMSSIPFKNNTFILFMMFTQLRGLYAHVD